MGGTHKVGLEHVPARKARTVPPRQTLAVGNEPREDTAEQDDAREHAQHVDEADQRLVLVIVGGGRPSLLRCVTVIVRGDGLAVTQLGRAHVEGVLSMAGEAGLVMRTKRRET